MPTKKSLAAYRKSSQAQRRDEDHSSQKNPYKILHHFPTLNSCIVNLGLQKPLLPVFVPALFSASSENPNLSGKDCTAAAMSGSTRYLQCCWVLGNFVTFNRKFSWRSCLGFNFSLRRRRKAKNKTKFVMNKIGRNSVKVISERSLRAVLGEAAKLFLQFMAIPLHLKTHQSLTTQLTCREKKYKII